MRRLPVFFLLDCSESMAGDNLRKMEEGLHAVVQSLRSDPHALETVHVSVIAFAGFAKTIVPLIELFSFYPPKLPLGGGTSLGAALDTLMSEIDRSVVRSGPERKGDWRPIVYLFTDGHPTDAPDAAIQRWRQEYDRSATIVAVGLGRDTDFSVLKRLTDQVLLFEESRPGDYKKFVDWISGSVLWRSKSLGELSEQPLSEVFDERIMRLVKDPPPSVVDPSCVTLVGRCQNNHKPYLLKYERKSQKLESSEFELKLFMYRLTGCYPLDESYFDWSDPRATGEMVNTSELIGSPSCPHCGNATAFAVCGCGKLMCLNGPGDAVCPWCEKTVSFELGASGEGHGVDVGRGRG
ncbi:TerY-C metal binding domain-containing protein [Thiorhodovibrio frisius]|uniref:VWFA domain-containing protein n=1 Tax=Thiorhodovibrio frisius TaxID=631362 RepID=H8YX67_9GAMM|nr:TerY-C metal binding domain-containing protein [Thiorhodovibrio frisius]EIC23043.1 uncharacterized protein Thi970DRAFT_00694 [Thiorhodovibrio frisius]WPL22692.1 putative protein encoded in toxicity protection [Thiorhodovibrio frisius]